MNFRDLLYLIVPLDELKAICVGFVSLKESLDFTAPTSLVENKNITAETPRTRRTAFLIGTQSM